MQGLFISDLHLFSRRSVGQKLWTGLQTRIRTTDCLVLGGDIFDFRWSHHGALERTLESAGNWLCDIAEQHPRMEVVYVLGNHDCHSPMQQLLTTLAHRELTFQWHEYFYRLGVKVFLHGDVLDAGIDEFQLQEYRSRFSAEDCSRGNVANFLYDVVVATRVHRLPGHVFHAPGKTVHRLSNYLSRINLAAENGIKQVYFGHTHQPLERAFGHQTYFNPGSGIRHLPFVPCFFDVPSVDLETGRDLSSQKPRH